MLSASTPSAALLVLPRSSEGVGVGDGRAASAAGETAKQASASRTDVNMIFGFFINVFLLIVGFSVFESARRSSLRAAQMCFYSLKRKSRLKPAKFFIASESSRAEFLKRFLKPGPKGRFAPRSLQTIARLRCRLRGTSKAAASRPLTAAEESANVTYSGSTAIPNGLGQLGTKAWFTFCPSRSAWPIVLPSLAQ